VRARELRLPNAPLVAVSYRLGGCDGEVIGTGDVAMLRGASVGVVVRPGDVRPVTLVVTLRNAAGRTLARAYRIAGASACR
jgi:hypothetical protein